MNKKIKKLWVDALRSGEYKQGKNQLRNEKNEFCCLGVLCNIHAQLHPKIAAKNKDQQYYYGDEDVLHQKLVEWAGLDDEVGGVVKYRKKGEDIILRNWTLAELNDAGVCFHTIADLIEEQL